jgi:NAD(P)-dependent dehydrogenase (short-subunit alcohol dehydrogenase family)
MARKHIIITGASSGIGLEVAKKLITEDHKLYLVIRNPEKIVDVKTELLLINPRGRLEVVIADLSSLKQTADAVDQILKSTDKIDILINNAGAMNSLKEITPEGFERTFVTNFLSPFLFTLKLLPALAKSEDKKVLNITSEMYRYNNLTEDYSFEHQHYDMGRAYANSKLALIYFTQWGAETWKDLGIKVNCMHPGMVDTAFGANTRWWVNWGLEIIRPFIRSAKKAAEDVVKIVQSKKFENVSGEYFKHDKLSEVSSDATNTMAMDALIQYSLDKFNALGFWNEPSL